MSTAGIFTVGVEGPCFYGWGSSRGPYGRQIPDAELHPCPSYRFFKIIYQHAIYAISRYLRLSEADQGFLAHVLQAHCRRSLEQ